MAVNASAVKELREKQAQECWIVKKRLKKQTVI